MAQAFLHGTGGNNPLNFKVVGALTVPSNPSENLIFVKSDIEIPYWTTNDNSAAPAYTAKQGTVVFWWESAKATEVSGTDFPGFMPVKYKATNPPGNMHLKPTYCYQNQDGTDSGWKRMDAYIYKSGEWVQFSFAFVATIAVTYPVGSTLTCFDGTTTLTATTTSGSYTFIVPNAGTWTVSCTDGNQTKSGTVEITAEGQAESLTLSYAVIIFKNGAFTKGGIAQVKESSSSYTRSEISGKKWATITDYTGWMIGFTSVKFDLTYVDTLYVTWSKSSSGQSGSGSVGVYSAQAIGKGVVTTGTTGTNIPLDVSKLSGEYYFGCYAGLPGTAVSSASYVKVSYIGSEV